MQTEEVLLGNEKIFDIDNGKRIRKEDINLAKGEIPVYSSSKFPNEVLGRVSEEILEVVPDAKRFDGKFITVNADGSVGKVFLREGSFYLNDIVNIIKIRNKNILPEYILYELQNKIISLGFTSWNNKLYKGKLAEIKIEIPIKPNGEFDLEKQKEIAEKYEKIEKIKRDMKNLFDEIISLRVEFEQDSLTNEFTLDNLFKQINGNSEYTKSYVFSHKGEYPVYSANTKQQGLFGHIDSYDHDLECVQLTTNGVYAGTFFYRKKHKFSINGDARLLIKKNKNLDYKYLLYELRKVFLEYGFNWENKPSQSKISDILLRVPVKPNGEFDLEKQKEIAEKYEKIEKIKRKISEDFSNVEDLKVEII